MPELSVRPVSVATVEAVDVLPLCQMLPLSPTVMNVCLKNAALLRLVVVGAADEYQVTPSRESTSTSSFTSGEIEMWLIPAAK